MTVKIEEWSVLKRWNPFNSYKLLAQVYRWRLIKRGAKIPQPALVTVDPCNICNHNCIWCNAKVVIKKSKNMLDKDILIEIADFLKEWQGSPGWEKGVEAVCIAGGGEPLMNQYVGDFIEKLISNGIEAGVVTNGYYIDKFIEPLSKCTWVGVSIDAGSKKIFNKLKGLSPKSENFDKIIDNINRLYEYSRKNNTRLGLKKPGYGIGYKYLLHPENIKDVFKAAKLAKEIGCKNFHVRPVGNTWDNLNNSYFKFSDEDINNFKEEIKRARELEDENFNVFAVVHKFGDQFQVANYFQNCYAIFMTCVFMPPIENDYKFVVGLCCDRRGDRRLELGKFNKTEELRQLWGSDKHWNIFDNINISDCPRCTYQPHNQIYEKVILEDSMTYKFI